MDGGALVLTGAPGAGKSSVLEALSDRLGDEGVAHGAFETEQLARGEPWLALEPTIPPETAAARVAAREPDWWSGKAALVEHARELAVTIPALPGVDAVVDNEGDALLDVAGRVRDAMAARGLLGG